MFKLVRFEIKKIWNTTFFRLFLVAMVLFFVGYYVFVYINTTRLEDVTKPLEDVLQTLELGLEENKQALESAKEELEIKELEETIEFEENYIKERKTEIEILEEENWDAILQIWIEDAEPYAESMRNSNDTHTYTHPTLFNLETYVAISKWMQEKDITPLLPADRHFSYLTFYDQEVNSTSRAEAELIMEFLKEQSNKYSSTSIHYLFRLFGILFSLTGAVFFLFLLGDIVTKEGLGRNGSINLLHTQPIKRHNILASKFFTAMLISLLILVSAILFSIIVGSVFDRIGDWHYPVLIYGEDRTFTLMSMGVFLIKAVGMFMLILFFCYTILFLFSIITKRALVALGLTIATILFGILVGEELITLGIAQYIPFQYFSVFEVLTNELALTLENFNLTYTNGMISLSIASLVLLVVIYLVSFIQTKISN
ncbi:ABC transporter permease [Paucisalibacillus sp. EB02]|uniref:ABC transporter permease n=1 Tax=Paucisalibacillus sp. EB02 TaxID=1347087 RepID=UPI0005AB604D|nr:ABC transporter permease subunit [Paucisalibacillus sp. EB02]